MKLLELEIHNIRGIRELPLKPAGENMVIWGPNGSGKSSVVDAIDFLLTGRVSRLMGQGTGGIKLSEHGRHVDSEPEKAWVRGVLQLPGLKDPVEIRRCLANPHDLDCTPASARLKLQPVLTLARRKQHVLTRREILKYVTSDRKTRGEKIQELLNVKEVEDIRAALVKVRHTLEAEWKAAKGKVKAEEGEVSAAIQIGAFDEKVIRQKVNENRAVLDGSPIAELRSDGLKVALRQPAGSTTGKGVDRGQFEKYVGNIQRALSPDNQKQMAEKERQLRSHLTEIRRDAQLLDALRKHQLIVLGLNLLDKSGNCPLCETPWKPGELQSYLEKRLADAQTAGDLKEKIERLSSEIASATNITLASIRYVLEGADQIGLPREEIALLQSWSSDMQKLADALTAPLEKYPLDGFAVEQLKRMLAPTDIEEVLTRAIEKVSAAYPTKSPELTAWDMLTILEEKLKRLERAQIKYQEASLAYQREQRLLDDFLSARDQILQQLFDDVRSRFEELYRQLHGTDEENFHALLTSKEAGIEFSVDFHGRGMHPPHALHSEGHQDSMGICLYLALAERLTEGKLDIIILDDVMMSIDADHRRGLCSLLAQAFPDKQFLITTHDKTWASQLKYEGVVSSKGMVELFNWDITTGPLVNSDVDMWERIQKDLDNNDISAAAAKLRRNLEMFSAMVCDALGARVTYKMNGRWELGDFLPAVRGRYSNLLKQAKKSAQSWGHQDKFERLQEVHSQARQIFERSNVEQWAVNANVHYNNWANFSRKDFEPVIGAFQDLYGLFACNHCGGLLQVAKANGKEVAVNCNCGSVNWNLKGKPKS